MNTNNQHRNLSTQLRFVKSYKQEQLRTNRAFNDFVRKIRNKKLVRQLNPDLE